MLCVRRGARCPHAQFVVHHALDPLVLSFYFIFHHLCLLFRTLTQLSLPFYLPLKPHVHYYFCSGIDPSTHRSSRFVQLVPGRRIVPSRPPALTISVKSRQVLLTRSSPASSISYSAHNKSPTFTFIQFRFHAQFHKPHPFPYTVHRFQYLSQIPAEILAPPFT